MSRKFDAPVSSRLNVNFIRTDNLGTGPTFQNLNFCLQSNQIDNFTCSIVKKILRISHLLFTSQGLNHLLSFCRTIVPEKNKISIFYFCFSLQQNRTTAGNKMTQALSSVANNRCADLIEINKEADLNPNWHEAGRIYPPGNFWIGF